MGLPTLADLERLAVPAAAVPIALSLVASVLPVAAIWLKKLWSTRLNVGDPLVESRVVEALKQRERNRVIAKWFGIMNGLLIFSQFVIGGLLASSFVQETVPAKVVGSFGLLVLFATLLHKHYRPDLVARGAQRRALALQLVIHRAENDLYALKAKATNPKPLLQIREDVTAGINAAIASEFDEREGETTLIPEKPSI